MSESLGFATAKNNKRLYSRRSDANEIKFKIDTADIASAKEVYSL